VFNSVYEDKMFIEHYIEGALNRSSVLDNLALVKPGKSSLTFTLKLHVWFSKPDRIAHVVLGAVGWALC